jgi:hypothetical protein
VCSTYFCKYDAAADGEHFWKSVHGLVGYVELLVSRHVTRALIPGHVEPTARGLTVEELEDLPPREADYQAPWGAWVGREEELYFQAYKPGGARPRSHANGQDMPTSSCSSATARRRGRGSPPPSPGAATPVRMAAGNAGEKCL